MPSYRAPTYSRDHKTGSAVLRWTDSTGRRWLSLGPYGSPESFRAYASAVRRLKLGKPLKTRKEAAADQATIDAIKSEISKPGTMAQAHRAAIHDELAAGVDQVLQLRLAKQELEKIDSRHAAAVQRYLRKRADFELAIAKLSVDLEPYLELERALYQPPALPKEVYVRLRSLRAEVDSLRRRAMSHAEFDPMRLAEVERALELLETAISEPDM